MDVPTIDITARDADLRLDEYRRALKTRLATPEDKRAMLLYAAAKRGRKLIDLARVFRECPVDDRGRPAVAVARADWRWCYWNADDSSAVKYYFHPNQSWANPRAKNTPTQITLPGNPVLRNKDHQPNFGRRWKCVVPQVPPQHRPTRKVTGWGAPGADGVALFDERQVEVPLAGYHLLFEAHWSDVPVDPYLLRHVAGTVYSIVAEWDLTPVEVAVLAGRLTEVS
jgi:hypothetical protein